MMKLTIKQDQDAESPREWSNLGRMYCWHRGYNLGDEQPKADPEEVLAGLPKGSIVLPLYLYEHGGITMSSGEFSDPFDSGQVGFIVATPDAIREAYMVKKITQATRDKVIACLKSEVETYDMFLRGDVWGFVVEEESTCDKGHTHREHVDSCWGFFGNDKDGIAQSIPDEVKSQLDEAWSNRGA